MRASLCSELIINFDLCVLSCHGPVSRDYVTFPRDVIEARKL